MQVNSYAAQAQQVNKFLDANRQLGAIMDQMQGTTRVIFDTTGSVGPISSFDFFENVTAKQFPATNIEQNKFQPGEGMVIKEISFQSFLDDTPPVQQLDFLKSTAMFSVVDVVIGNLRVIKALPLTAFSTIAALNPLNQQAVKPVNGAGEAVVPQNVYTFARMRTNIVIPPEVYFKVTLRFPFPAGSANAPVNVKCALKGYGKLFNPGANF
jgi:hypothetical protein